MICLYEKDETAFTDNGIVSLDPTVCVAAELAGGSYTLHLEHPMDEAGKYTMLVEERIIKAPVPPKHVKAITLPNVKVWVTNQATRLYTALPTYRRKPCPENIKKVKQSPWLYAWNNTTVYQQDALVTYQGNIYSAKSLNYQVPPTSMADIWKYETTVAGSGDTIIENGGTYTDIAADVQVTKIADYNETYVQVRMMHGNAGYINKGTITETQTEMSGQTIPAFDITEQLFRIYEVSGEDDTQTITVEAKHISYDFQGNALYSCKIVDADPMTAISIMQGSLLDPDARVIACDISGKTLNEDWSFYNPINALLDPDEGLVPVLGAQLIRNNRDFYILSNDSPRKGITIAYGYNMTGVYWSRNVENVITRVLPRCGDGNDGWLYIDNIYVESEISTEYAFQRTEMLDAGFDVGDKQKKADGTEITIDTATAKQMMEEKAQNRFTVDRCDAAEVELDVQFILLGDTEEYKQYRGLQTVCLYDEITVVMPKSRMTATAQVVEYEYDSIRKRYNSIKIGDIKSMQRQIPGYRLKRNSITYDKLGSSLISRIKGMNATTVTEGE